MFIHGVQTYFPRFLDLIKINGVDDHSILNMAPHNGAQLCWVVRQRGGQDRRVSVTGLGTMMVWQA